MVNTVNFSNHSGYGRLGGTRSTAAELNSIFENMERNELLIPTRLLTGIYDFFSVVRLGSLYFTNSPSYS